MSVLIKPVVTEKTTSESELRNRYTFLVDPKANKVEIKKAVEATYGVTVDKVRTLIYGPEQNTLHQNRNSAWENQCNQTCDSTGCRRGSN